MSPLEGVAGSDAATAADGEESWRATWRGENMQRNAKAKSWPHASPSVVSSRSDSPLLPDDEFRGSFSGSPAASITELPRILIFAVAGQSRRSSSSSTCRAAILLKDVDPSGLVSASFKKQTVMRDRSWVIRPGPPSS